MDEVKKKPGKKSKKMTDLMDFLSENPVLAACQVMTILMIPVVIWCLVTVFSISDSFLPGSVVAMGENCVTVRYYATNGGSRMHTFQTERDFEIGDNVTVQIGCYSISLCESEEEA